MTKELLLGIVFGLVVNETCDLSPWLAKRLVRVAVRLKYPEGRRRQIRLVELQSVIDERPGKLFKLITAVAFTVAALPSWSSRAVIKNLTATVLLFGSVRSREAGPTGQDVLWRLVQDTLRLGTEQEIKVKIDGTWLSRDNFEVTSFGMTGKTVEIGLRTQNAEMSISIPKENLPQSVLRRRSL